MTVATGDVVVTTVAASAVRCTWLGAGDLCKGSVCFGRAEVVAGKAALLQRAGLAEVCAPDVHAVREVGYCACLCGGGTADGFEAQGRACFCVAFGASGLGFGCVGPVIVT